MSLRSIPTLLASSLILASVAGCDSTIDGGGGEGGDDPGTGAEALGAAPFQNGSRLKAIVLRADSEVDVLDGWQDTQLGVECQFHRAVDGVQRCMPSFYGVYYADAACTQPVVSMGWTEMPEGPAFGEVYVPTGMCDGESYGHVFQRTSDEAVSYSVVYQSDGDGGCIADPTTDMGDIVGYAAVAVPPTTFVAATETYEALGEDLGRLVSVHEDGSAHALSAATPDGTPCDRVGDDACVPSGRVTVRNGFTDGACSAATDHVAVSVCGATHASTYTYTRERTCEVPQIFELGALATGVGYSDMDDTGTPMCSPLNPEAQVAIPRALTEFPAFTSTVESGSAPGLAARYDARGDVPTTSYYQLETADGVPCVPSYDYDRDTYFCVPSPVSLISDELFSDPECRVRLISEDPNGYQGAQGCDAPRSASVFGDTGRDIHAVNPALYTGPVYQFGETCEQVTEDLPLLHELGALLDLDALPGLTRVTTE